MIKERCLYNNTHLIRVTKRIAEKYYNNNKEVYLVPYKANINSSWISVARIHKKENNDSRFSTHCDIFQKCCCNTMLGKYIKFFVNENDKFL